MPILSKFVYRFNVILIRIPVRFLFFLIGTHKLILKLIWKGAGLRIPKTVLKKKNKVEESPYPTLRLAI